MAKTGLIFTTDYEIFGNGTGSVEDCMLKPTARIAQVMEKVDAPLTIFLDVCEYWAFEKEFKKGNLEADYAAQIKQQLQGLVKRGHDVQLHFHPQWLDYTYVKGKWRLNFDLWRIGRLQYEDKDHPERSLKKLFPKGKETLEEMLKPVQSSYECNVFRSGAWSMQPETDVLRAMRESGFRLDSTVAPEMQFEDDYTFYDFRKAPKVPYWNVQNNLLYAEEEGILEVPIFTTHVPFLKKLKFLNLKSKRGIPLKPEGCTGTALASAGKSKFRKMTEVFKNGHNMFNFSDATSSEEMIYFAQQAMKRYAARQEDLIPVVAISHPKTFANESELDAFLVWAANQTPVEFTTFQQFI